jgi:hypothetical protein
MAVGGGVTSDTGAVYINKTTMGQNTVLNTGENGLVVGPLTISSGVTFTVSSGQRYVVL